MSEEEKEVDLDFEILREPWNRYSLKDGSYIRSRYVLTKVKRRGVFEKTERREQYGIEGQNITVVYNVPAELKGPPTTTSTPSPQELSKSIAVDDVPYDTLSEEWNEYIIEDGTKIKVKDTIVKIARTNKTDKDGNPIYLVQHGTMVGVTPALARKKV